MNGAKGFIRKGPLIAAILAALVISPSRMPESRADSGTCSPGQACSYLVEITDEWSYGEYVCIEMTITEACGFAPLCAATCWIRGCSNGILTFSGMCLGPVCV